MARLAPDLHGSRRATMALIGAWLLVIAVLVAWLAMTPKAALREQLKVLQFWWLEACLALGLALGAMVARDLWRSLTVVHRVRIAALTALAVGLVVLVAPRTNRIFYDEQIYQGIAQNLTDLKLAQMCNEGTVEYGRLQCAAGEYNKQPHAYPHLLSAAYRVAGVGPTIAFVVNVLVMAASVIVVYLLTLTLFDDAMAAGFAALLLTFMPEQLMWAATAAVEPSAALMCTTALLATAHFCRTRTTVALAAAAVSAAYAVQFRPEAMLIVPVLATLVWVGARDELVRTRFWWVGLLALALVAVHVGHLYAVRNEGWGTTEARLSLDYVAANLGVNGRFYLGDGRFPVLVTVLAVAGLATTRQDRFRMVLVVAFLVFFGIDLLFYAGSYDYGADVRYSLMTYPPLAVLAGLGTSGLVRTLGRWGLSQGIVTAALVLQFLWYVPLVRATTEEAWAARADVAFVDAMAPELGGNTFVLTHNPSMFHVRGINAGQMSIVVANPSYLDYLAGRYAGGVYLHWNFWCNVDDAAQRAVCDQAVALKPTKLVREQRVRDQRFAFHRFGTAELTSRD